MLSLGVLRALAARPQDFAEVALLLVCDEEWRTAPFGHTERFAGWDACLCFEGGARTPDGEEGVVVRRKAAGTLRVQRARPRRALGLGARPRAQRAARARRRRAGGRRLPRPRRPRPPDRGADRHARRRRVQRRPRRRRARQRHARRRRSTPSSAWSPRCPPRSAARRCTPRWCACGRAWTPARRTGPLLERASAALGQTVAAMHRGGASDASHFAAAIPRHGRRARPARRRRPQPRRVHRRGVAGHPRGGRARGRAGRAQPLTASDSSSRGRSSTISSPGGRGGGPRRPRPS